MTRLQIPVDFRCDKLAFRHLHFWRLPENLQPLWHQLVGEDLSGIVFVRDYLQLQFNPPAQVSVYSRRVVVSSDGRSAAFGEDAFANLASGI
jgi:hypothetical protein